MEERKIIPFGNWNYRINKCWEIQRLHRYKKIRLSMKTTLRALYPRVSLCHNYEKKNYMVNRLMWCAFLWLNMEDRRTLVLHLDDNPSNNNLNNLSLWTQADNMKDMRRKWRDNFLKWSSHPMAKLNEEKVRQIKLSYNLNSQTLWNIYWVSRDMIDRIRAWKNRTHVMI